jgi:hypothetical protein
MLKTADNPKTTTNAKSEHPKTANNAKAENSKVAGSLKGSDNSKATQAAKPAAADNSVKPTAAEHIAKTPRRDAMTTPAVILVGADKGGVGKTTITRTLLDYLAAKGIPCRAFDTESPKGALVRFHPNITEVVDVTAASDQMKIFDTINVAEATVIDVRAGLLSATLTALRNIGFLDLARNGDCTFAVFHILGPSIASLDEITETSGFLSGTHHFLVKNLINNSTFFEWDPATYNTYFKKIKGAREFTVPRLNELACEQVELASVPFKSFIDNKTASGTPAANSFVLRGYVRHWLSQVWSEYDRVEVTDLVSHKHKAA